MEPSLRFTARRKILSGFPAAPPPRRPCPSRTNPGSDDVTKMVSSQTMGVAALQFGSFKRQRTFSVSDQDTGRSRTVVVLPFRLGPRHCGQFAGSEMPGPKPTDKTI